jgi:hypothetical protein
MDRAGGSDTDDVYDLRGRCGCFVTVLLLGSDLSTSYRILVVGDFGYTFYGYSSDINRDNHVEYERRSRRAEPTTSWRQRKITS